MNYFVWAAAAVVLAVGLYMAVHYRRKIEEFERISAGIVQLNEEMKRTLQKGLNARFQAASEGGESPDDFEAFVGSVLERCYGGRVVVTPRSGDYGVDLEYTREDGGLYLGQVKCYAEDQPVGFDPVAIIHSQMIKRKAVGGFVVTTSDFTQHAKDYAEGLKIQLINGAKLIELWATAMENEVRMGLELKK